MSRRPGAPADNAITSASRLIPREIFEHMLRINKLAMRLLPFLNVSEVRAVNQTLKAAGLTTRASVNTRRRQLHICGGSDGRKLVDVGYRLDFESERWEPMAPMRQLRVQGAGVVNAGRIFLCGGSDGQGISSTVECFNPGMRRWESAPSMQQARCGASAVSVGGSIYVCGGRGGPDVGYLSSAERCTPKLAEGVYDQETGMESFFTTCLGTEWKWRVATFCRGTVIDARDYVHERAILRSRPFVLTPTTQLSLTTQGGVGVQESIVGMPATVEGLTNKQGFLGMALHDVAEETWILSKRRTFCGASTWKEGSLGKEGSGNEETLFFTSEELAPFAGREVSLDLVDTYSGYFGWISVSRAQVSSVECTGEWDAIAPMKERRCYAVAAKVPGQLLVCGGLNHPARSLSSVEAFDPSADGGMGSWTHVLPMSQGRACAVGAAVGGRYIYVCGGSDGTGELCSAERYNGGTGQWEIVGEMSQRRRFAAAAVCAGSLYVFGGVDGKKYLTSGERFASDQLRFETRVAAMPEPRVFGYAAYVEGPI